MKGEVINVPLRLIRQYSTTPQRFRELCCAIMIRCAYINSKLYNTTTKHLCEVFSCCNKTAKKIKSALLNSDLFEYDREHDVLTVKSFKSTEKREFGKGRKRFYSSDDFCVKISRDFKNLKLRHAAKALNKLLIEHVVNERQRKESLTQASSESSDAPSPAVILTQSEISKAVGVSKSSISRYTDELRNEGKVDKSKSIVELVIPEYTPESFEDYKKRHPNEYVYIAYSSLYNHQWCFANRGCSYSLKDEKEHKMFQHVIYDHKLRKQARFAPSNPNKKVTIKFDDYHENFYSKGRIF